MPLKISYSAEGRKLYDCFLLPSTSETITGEPTGYPAQLVVECNPDDSGGVIYRPAEGEVSEGLSQDREEIIANGEVETVIGSNESFERFMSVGSQLVTITIRHYSE